MFRAKIKIGAELLKKIEQAAAALGCSAQEFVDKVLLTESERVLTEIGGAEVSEDELKRVANQLKGLGYIE